MLSLREANVYLDVGLVQEPYRRLKSKVSLVLSRALSASLRSQCCSIPCFIVYVPLG